MINLISQEVIPCTDLDGRTYLKVISCYQEEEKTLNVAYRYFVDALIVGSLESEIDWQVFTPEKIQLTLDGRKYDAERILLEGANYVDIQSLNDCGISVSFGI